MPETESLVINTAPLIAIVAALGDLTVLQSLYTQVLVPFEVCQEILVGGSSGFAVAEFEAATWLQKQQTPLNIAILVAVRYIQLYSHCPMPHAPCPKTENVVPHSVMNFAREQSGESDSSES